MRSRARPIQVGIYLTDGQHLVYIEHVTAVAILAEDCMTLERVTIPFSQVGAWVTPAQWEALERAS